MQTERGAVIERFIATRGGTPLIQNQSKAIFLVQDKDGVTPRIVGDFNDWAAAANGQDPSVGLPTRIEGTDWSYLETTVYTNARAEYVLLFPIEAVADPKNPRTVNAFAGPRSEVRMPQWVAAARDRRRERRARRFSHRRGGAVQDAGNGAPGVVLHAAWL